MKKESWLYITYKNLIEKIEAADASFVYFLITFFSIITVRNFVELFSDKAELWLKNILHYYLFYTALALSLIILFHLITKTNLGKIIKVVATGFIFCWLAPILDLILTSGRGNDMCYLQPEMYDNLLTQFLLFFPILKDCGITIGMKIEMMVILLGCLGYFYVKSGAKIKSLVGMALSYCILFFYMTIPFSVNGLLSILHIKYFYSNEIMISFFLLIIFIQVVVLAFVSSKQKILAIIIDLRLFRILFYLLMLVLGLIIGWLKTNYTEFSQELLSSLILVLISFIFAWLYSVITNNIADINIDKKSNGDRPHVNPNSPISSKEYRIIAWSALACALIYGAAAGPEALFMIALFIGNYFIYSMPPLRLKRLTFFSKLFIGLNSLIIMMLGYMMITDQILTFPPTVAIFVLAGFTAAANFIDIKDYEGDKHEQIMTLPVALGLQKAKWIIGMMFPLINASAYFIIKNAFILPFLILFGLMELFYITRKNYDEMPVFLVLLFNVLFVVIFLMIK